MERINGIAYPLEINSKPKEMATVGLVNNHRVFQRSLNGNMSQLQLDQIYGPRNKAISESMSHFCKILLKSLNARGEPTRFMARTNHYALWRDREF